MLVFLLKAPEVIQQKDPNCYSTCADVYAYGCVLFEMFAGKLPHAPINNKEQVRSSALLSYLNGTLSFIRFQIMWLVGKGRLKIKVEQCRDDTPESIIELIRACTEFDREQRPDFAPEVCSSKKRFSLCYRMNFFSFRSMISYLNLNLFFHAFNAHNQSHV